MRIAVFGAGAVGCYFGGRLAHAGEDVVFIARGKQLRALREEGLAVESFKGDFTVSPVQATDDPAHPGQVDAVLLAVKAWQVPEAARAMRPLVGSDTAVVPFENGVEAPLQLAVALGPEHALGGMCRIFAVVDAPGHVRHFGSEPLAVFGELDNRRTERVETLRDAFTRAGVAAEVPPNIHVAMWEKLLYVGPLGGLGATTRAPVGVLRGVPEVRAMLETAMREIVAVARGRGIPVPDDSVVRAMAYVDTMPPGATTSMQRDINDGKASELSAQIGAVVRLGETAGVPTPLHSFLYHSLLPLERRARGEIVFPS